MAKRIGRFAGIPPWEHNKRVRFWKDMRAATRAFNRAMRSLQSFAHVLSVFGRSDAPG
jgi:hypothetical protein